MANFTVRKTMVQPMDTWDRTPVALIAEVQLTYGGEELVPTEAGYNAMLGKLFGSYAASSVRLLAVSMLASDETRHLIKVVLYGTSDSPSEQLEAYLRRITSITEHSFLELETTPYHQEQMKG